MKTYLSLPRKALSRLYGGGQGSKFLWGIPIAFTLSAIILWSSATQAQTNQQFTLHLNIGSGESYTDTNGTVFVPDQAWSVFSRAGYVGELPEQRFLFWPIGGTQNEELYRTQSRNWREYRVSGLPNGEYLVELFFADPYSHGPGISKFDVQIEGQTVLSQFDPVVAAGTAYAVNRKFRVNVQDGELNIVGIPKTGQTHLAALSVKESVPNTIRPAAPGNVKSTSSYGAVILNWDAPPDSDLDRYDVYRSPSPSGPYSRLTPNGIHISRYIDKFDPVNAPTLPTWYYKIQSIDVYGNRSLESEVVTGTPLQISQAALPVYQLEVSTENMQKLYENPWTNEEVGGTFIIEGYRYPALVRFRGQYGRGFPKKSWEIIFPDHSPFPNRKRLNLKSHYEDNSLMRGLLTHTMYEDVGIRPPKATHTLLFLNNEYLGLFTDYEQIDKDFLERTNRNSEGSIYRANLTEHGNYGDLFPDASIYAEVYDKKTNKSLGYGDIIEWSERINLTPQSVKTFRIAETFDIASFLDYYAAIVFTGNIDFTQHNVYLLHDLSTNLWEIVPWDPDYTWGIDGPFELGVKYTNPIDMGTLNSPGVFGGANTLLNTILEVPAYQTYYCNRLSQLIDESYIDRLYPRIERIHQSIEQAGRGDWHKFGWEDNDWFDASIDQIKEYVQKRSDFLGSQMVDYCPAPIPTLKINEILVNPNITLCNDCSVSWFELYNDGLEAVALNGLYLTDDPSDPTKYQISLFTILNPGEFIHFFADTRFNLGENQTNFTLNAESTGLYLYASDGVTLVDNYDLQNHTPHPNRTAESNGAFSIGRYPDGAGTSYEFTEPSPQSSNQLAPIIAQVYQKSLLIAEGTPATIYAKIYDDAALRPLDGDPTSTGITLYYQLMDGAEHSIDMERVAYGLYSASIPPYPTNTHIKYHVQAFNLKGPSQQPETGYYDYVVDYEKPTLYLNELMISNGPIDSGSTLNSQDSSWLELHNTSLSSVYLNGMYLSDDPKHPRKFRITDPKFITPDSYVVFFADGRPELGPRHTNFVLDPNGGTILLSDSDDVFNQSIDLHEYSPQRENASEQRCVNELEFWFLSDTPTLGHLNNIKCSTIYLPVAERSP